MLNLLPPEIKNQSKVTAKVSNLVLAYIIVLSVIVLGAAGLFTYNLTVSSKISDQQSQLNDLAAQKQKAAADTAKLALIQDRLSVAGQFQEKKEWDTLLGQVASDTPGSVQLTDLKITVDAAKGTTLVVSGQTNSQRDIVLFQDKLAVDKSFTGAAIQTLTPATSGNKTASFVIQAGVAK